MEKSLKTLIEERHKLLLKLYYTGDLLAASNALVMDKMVLNICHNDKLNTSEIKKLLRLEIRDLKETIELAHCRNVYL